MAVTVTGKNYTQISSCNSDSAGGSWSGSPAIDSANYKEGGASISDIFKTSGDNTWTFTPTTAIDLSGTKHLRIWFLATHGGLINLKANGGIQLFVSDGTNTGYWYMAGRDTYAGGWINLVQNVANPVNAGIKPTAMNTITSLGVRINLTAAAKNADNTWVDNLCVADGLIAYGDDAGGYFDFDDIFSADDTSLGIGIVRKISGQYFFTGSLEIGDSTTSSTNATKFQAKSQVAVFENRPVDSNLYNMTAVDGGGTGTTEFILGSKSGTAGIEGCVIRVADTTQTPKYDIDASTDTDISDFMLYGSTFLDADSISFPPDGTNIEVINCNFESSGEVLADTCDVTNCNFVSANDRGVQMSSTSHSITSSSFISCAHGINIPNAGTYSFSNLVFTNCTYAIENSSASGAVIVNATGTSDPTNYENTDSGTTTINNNKSVTITIYNQAGDVLPGVEVAIFQDDASRTVVLTSTATDENGQISTTAASGLGAIIIRVRQSTSLATFSTAQAFTSEVVTTDADHNFRDGDAVVYGKDGGVAVIGLTENTTYYVNSITATTLSLHTTAALAISGTSPVDLTTAGTETHQLDPIRYIANSATGTIGTTDFSTQITMVIDSIATG